MYGYPHKTAYRPLWPRPALRDVWSAERRDRLFLYLHLPFCEMRCGFCNLFTRSNPPDGQVRDYLDQLRRQADRVRDGLGAGVDFARIAVGGGTPTHLTGSELHLMFDLLADFGARLGVVPMSVETSPATATPDRIAVLAERGTTRVSIGVQSFLDVEARAAGRPQRRTTVERALSTIREHATLELNLDLIYGIPGQTARSWAESIEAALRWRPEELFLYPLYVRPLTGLARRAATLVGSPAPGRDSDPGWDAHYSFDCAVGVGQVRAIIEDYLRRPAGDFEVAEVGFRLDPAERRRRWLVTSLLRADGCDPAAYRDRFGSALGDDFPQLTALAERGWLDPGDSRVALTEAGLERSDAIGPWLVSGPVRTAMTGYSSR